MQYYVGNMTEDGMTVEPLSYVTDVDDEEFLVNQFESLLQRSSAAGPSFKICMLRANITLVFLE